MHGQRRPVHAGLRPPACSIPTIAPLCPHAAVPQGDINDAARSLAPLADLQEVGLYDNQLSGSIEDGGPLCQLAQVRTRGRALAGWPCSPERLQAWLSGNHMQLQQTAGGAAVLLPGPSHAPSPAAHACLQGRLEMLRLGNMGLTGALPACLFNGNATLFQVGD